MEANNNNNNNNTMATSITGLQTNLDDEQVKPRVATERVAAAQPAAAACLSADVPPQPIRWEYEPGAAQKRAPPPSNANQSKNPDGERINCCSGEGAKGTTGGIR